MRMRSIAEATMAGKTQFTEHMTVNLTPEQASAVEALMQLLGQSRRDTIVDALAERCERYGIEWPQIVKRAPGRRNAPRNEKGEFMKS